MSDQDRLQRASDLGCFGKLKIEGEPQYMRISGKDFSMESWVLMGKGTTGITYMILPNGMMYNYDEYKKDPSQRDPNKTLEMKWTCPNLDISPDAGLSGQPTAAAGALRGGHGWPSRLRGGGAGGGTAGSAPDPGVAER